MERLSPDRQITAQDIDCLKVGSIQVDENMHVEELCTPDSLKLGFRCTRKLVVRIHWPII